jgi:hypothetical protein
LQKLRDFFLKLFSRIQNHPQLQNAALQKPLHYQQQKEKKEKQGL